MTRETSIRRADALPPSLELLAGDALAQGFRIVNALIDDWAAGRNRFERPGEALYIADLDGIVVGVCGVNHDPYAADLGIGRVRRLYVSSEHRRRGIATALIRRLVDDARPKFRLLRLRTLDEDACRFYESQGFEPVRDDPYCTHRRVLGG